MSRAYIAIRTSTSCTASSVNAMMLAAMLYRPSGKVPANPDSVENWQGKPLSDHRTSALGKGIN